MKTTEFLKKAVKGCSLQEFMTEAESKGLKVRIMSVDGTSEQVFDAMFKEDRINVEVERGVISDVLGFF